MKLIARPLGSAPDRWAGGAMVALAGVGTVAAAGGAAAGQLPLTVVGAAAGAVGLGFLIAAGSLNPLLLVALAIPLPALLSDESVRIATVAPVAAVAVAAWALGAGTRGVVRTEELPRRSLLLLVGALFVAALFSQAPVSAARELLNLGVLLALVVAAVDLLAEAPSRRRQIVAVLAATAGVTAVLAVLQTVGVIPGEFPRTGTSFNRAALGFGQPNALGLFLALAVPLIAYCRSSASGPVARTLWTVCLGVVGLGLVGTFSRGSWLAVVLGAGALLAVGEGRTVTRIWITTAVLAVIADLLTGGALRDTAARTVGDWVLEQRAALMLAGVLMFVDYPLLGVGPGGFAELVEEYAPLLPQLFDIQPTPHNALIQMAAESGVVGLAALLLFLALVFRVLRRRALVARHPDERSLQLALLWSFGTIAVASMAMWPFAHGTGEAVVMVLALACVASPREHQHGSV